MSPKTVVIIEDERHIARFLEFILENAGYDVTVATDGAQGLTAINKLLPDVVMLDLGLPDMSGREVLRNIRANHNSAAAKVVVLTAELHDGSSGELLDTGADAHCTKPIAPTTLLRTLSNLYQ